MIKCGKGSLLFSISKINNCHNNFFESNEVVKKPYLGRCNASPEVGVSGSWKSGKNTNISPSEGVRRINFYLRNFRVRRRCIARGRGRFKHKYQHLHFTHIPVRNGGGARAEATELSARRVSRAGSEEHPVSGKQRQTKTIKLCGARPFGTGEVR
jgi:hypothetical protein